MVIEKQSLSTPLTFIIAGTNTNNVPKHHHKFQTYSPKSLRTFKRFAKTKQSTTPITEIFVYADSALAKQDTPNYRYDPLSLINDIDRIVPDKFKIRMFQQVTDIILLPSKQTINAYNILYMYSEKSALLQA